MKTNRNIIRLSSIVLLLFVFSVTQAFAQFGPYSRALKRAKKVKNAAEARNRNVDKAINEEADKTGKKTAARTKNMKTDALTPSHPKSMGDVIFSAVPINPTAPRKLTTNFRCGDNIYGLIRLKKPLRVSDTRGAWYAQLDVRVYVDGKLRPDGAFWVREKLSPKKNLIFNVAPKPENLISYENYDVVYQPLPKSWGTCGGPLQLTKLLATLPAGKHDVRIVVKHGKLQAVGAFTVKGDFKPYAKLFDGLLTRSIIRMKLPKPGMVDKELEEQMVEAVKNYGRPFASCDILRVVIINPKWEVTDTNQGKDGSVHFRTLHTAIALKDPAGKYWIYRRAIFVENFDRSINTYGNPKLLDTGFRMETIRENVIPEQPKKKNE